jgi:hypothetical protein
MCAIKRVSAMPAEQPGIMQGKDRRNMLAQPGQNSQIKVATVQVVAVNDIWQLRWQV